MSDSTYVANKKLDHAFNKAAYAPLTTRYLALSTADPTDEGTGLAEPSGDTGYTRIATTGADWGGAAARAIANTAVKDFPKATGSMGTITHFAIMDADTAGNVCEYGELTTPKAFGAGDIPRFEAGSLVISVAATA